MFKCLRNEGPAYLSKDLEMLSSILGKQKLRSVNSLKVVPGKSKLKTIGKKIFYVTGPTLWNNLPEKLRFSVSKHSFGRNLKSFFEILWCINIYVLFGSHFLHNDLVA